MVFFFFPGFAAEGKTPADKLKQYTLRAYQELEQEKLRELLDRYRLILSQKGVITLCFLSKLFCSLSY